MANIPALILASSSVYRRELLERLQLPFAVMAPGVEELTEAGERPIETAARLARAKARAVAIEHPDAVVIGSDQVADLAGAALGKPGDHARACAQLRSMRGHLVLFHTAVAVVCVARQIDINDLATVRVRFNNYSEADIEQYLRAEQPYDCAGSARSEGLGIALLASVESDDPTALIGLPLIRTCALLRRAGIEPLRVAGA